MGTYIIDIHRYQVRHRRTARRRISTLTWWRGLRLSEIQPRLETPSHRFDHTLVHGENNIWTVGRRGGSEGHYSRQFQRLKAVTSAKKRSELYPPFALLYTVALQGHVGPGNERKGARAGGKDG